MSEARLSAAEREALIEAIQNGEQDAWVEAIIAARLAAVEALADEWLSEECEDSEVTYGSCGDHLRAALTAAPDSEDRQAGRALRGPGSRSESTGEEQ